MPKRKKLPSLPEIPNLSGLGRKDKDCNNWLVQKSNPLKSLSETDLELQHFKILDVYLSRIDSRVPESRYVQFSKGELEQLLGYSRMHRDDLDKRLNGLFRAVTIRDERKPNNFVKIGLFAKAECEQDADGLWQVRLACTAEAMEYFFNVENIGYIKYRLKNIINLTSRYSYVLFLYLYDNHFRKTWSISVKELKTILRCSADTYTEFKRFNDLVLKKCFKEINEKTVLKYSYEPIKKGRTITEIRFTVLSVSETLPVIDTQVSNETSMSDTQLMFDNLDENEIDYGSNLANLLGSVACNNEFTIEQIAMIKDLVLDAVPKGTDIERCNYLKHLMHTMDYYGTKEKIYNRFSYLCKMLEKDIKE